MYATIRRLWRRYVVHARFAMRLYFAFLRQRVALVEARMTWKRYRSFALRQMRHELRELREEMRIKHERWMMVPVIYWIDEYFCNPGCPHCGNRLLQRWQTIRYVSPAGELSRTQWLVLHCHHCGKDSNGSMLFSRDRIRYPDPPPRRPERIHARVTTP